MTSPDTAGAINPADLPSTASPEPTAAPLGDQPRDANGAPASDNAGTLPPVATDDAGEHVRTYRPAPVDGVELAAVVLLDGQDDPDTARELAPVAGEQKAEPIKLAPYAEPVEGADLTATSEAVRLSEAPSLATTGDPLPDAPAPAETIPASAGTVPAPTTTAPDPTTPASTPAPDTSSTSSTPDAGAPVPPFTDAPSTTTTTTTTDTTATPAV